MHVYRAAALRLVNCQHLARVCLCMRRPDGCQAMHASVCACLVLTVVVRLPRCQQDGCRATILWSSS